MPNSNQRGGAAARRARKTFLLNKFGDGTIAPCHECGALVTFETMCVDRIIPAKAGGTYRRNNIGVHCKGCSDKQGPKIRMQQYGT